MNEQATLPPENELKALVSLLHDEDMEILTHVESKILSLGNPLISYLEQEWEVSEREPDVQKRIEELIHTLQFDELHKKLKLWKDEGGSNLLEGVWLVATYQFPTLSFDEIRQQIEQIYYDAWLEVDTNLHPFEQIRNLNHVFFEKNGFGALTNNFHSPNSNLINKVLETKRGNPSSLCIIYMLIAQKLRMPVYGLNLPNQFILVYKDEYAPFYINVYSRGIIFSKADIDNHLKNLNFEPIPAFHEPCSNLEIVTRVLRNLHYAYEKQGDEIRQEEVASLLKVLG
jgi:regulator of sirC expression with transglutaminase-like and TPR domain